MSHFSFTRNSYDDCALDKKNQESTSPFKWITDSSVVESNQSCFLKASPFQQNPFKSIPVGSVDIESDLRGQTFRASKCATHKYNPNKATPVETKINDCKDEGLIPSYTRLNKSCNVLSGVSINRFHPLCEDVQDLFKIHKNDYIGINTRLQIKDTFQNKKL